MGVRCFLRGCKFGFVGRRLGLRFVAVCRRCRYPHIEDSLFVVWKGMGNHPLNIIKDGCPSGYGGCRGVCVVVFVLRLF